MSRPPGFFKQELNVTARERIEKSLADLPAISANDGPDEETRQIVCLNSDDVVEAFSKSVSPIAADLVKGAKAAGPKKKIYQLVDQVREAVEGL